MRAGLTRPSLVWGLWGFALAFVPCALRIDGVFAPLQFSLPALAVALVALAGTQLLLDHRGKSVLARLLDRGAIPIAVLGPLAIATFEAHDLPYPSALAQAISLAAWACYGTLCLPRRDEKPPCAWALFLGAVAPTAARLAPELMRPGLPVTLLACAAAAVLAGAFCARVARSNPERFTASLTCGVTLAAAFRESAAALVELSVPVDHPADLMTLLTIYLVYLAGFLVLITVSAVLCARASRVRQAPEPTAPDPDPLCRLPGADGLSERQRFVLSRAIDGGTGAEIARELGISTGTVGTYRARGLARLGMASLAELKEHMVKAQEAQREREAREVEACQKRQALTGLAVLAAIAAPVLTYTALTPIGRSPFPFVAPLVGGIIVAAVAPALARTQATEKPCRLSPLGLAALVAVGLCLPVTWSYRASANWAFCLALVLLSALALDHPTARHTGVRELLRTAFVGIRELFLGSPWHALALGAGILCAPALTWTGGYHDISRPFSVAAVLCAALVARAWTLRHQPAQPTSSAASDASNPELVALMRNHSLGETEARVVLLAAQGLNRSEICRELCVAPGTVNGYKATAYRKLGIHEAGELVRILEESAGEDLSSDLHNTC